MDSLEKMSGRSGTSSLCKCFDVLDLQLLNITLLISSFILVLLHGRDPNPVGSGLEGQCWAGFSIALPEAAVWCLQQLCRTVNCFISLESQRQWIRGSTNVLVLISGYSLSRK